MGDSGGDRRPLLPVRRRPVAYEPRPAAVHRRSRPTWSVDRAAAPPYKPDYDPDSASTGTMWATGPEDDRRADLAGSEQRDRRAGQEPADRARARAEAGQADRQRHDRGDHRRDAGGARLAHQRCGAARARRTPVNRVHDGDEGSGRPRLDRRADRSITGSTSCSAAAARASQQTITGGPTSARRWMQSAARQGYTEVNDAAGLDARGSDARRVLGLFTPVNMTTEWNGPQATAVTARRRSAARHHRPANEPSLPAMTRKAIDLLEDDRDGFFLQVEGASIDKQDHVANACEQIGETIAFDHAIARRAGLRAPQPRHADRRDRRSRRTRARSSARTRAAPATRPATRTTSPRPTTRSLRVTYGTAGGATPPAVPPSQQHTGTVVPIFAPGPRSGRGARHRPTTRTSSRSSAAGTDAPSHRSVGAGPRTDRPEPLRWIVA